MLRCQQKNVTILRNGHLVSRSSDWIMYSVEAKLIDAVVAQFGPSTKQGAIVGGQNNTGGGSDVTIPRGATGAETYQSNSAAAGNASQPERAVPQGSGGAGGSGGAN